MIILKIMNKILNQLEKAFILEQENQIKVFILLMI